MYAGFEYWSDPNSRLDGYVQWMVDGNPTHRVGAAAVGPDQGSSGSGVGQRLIPEEPMSIVFNLAISREHFIVLYLSKTGRELFFIQLIGRRWMFRR